MPDKQYPAGIKAAIPIIFAFVPIGIAYAVLARQAGLSVFETVLMSLTVFAGASQIMASGMIAQGAGLFAIALATFVLNLRHFIMSTCVFQKMEHVPAWKRILASFFVTDESFAIFTTDKRSTLKFFLGIITITYSSWVLGSFLGAVLADFLPEIISAACGIAFYAMFLAMLVPSLKVNGRLLVLVILTGICNMILVQFMASSWALIISTLVCAFIGMFFVNLPAEGTK